MASQGSTARTAKLERQCSQRLRLSLSPSECILPIDYQPKSHCITSGARHLPPLSCFSQVIYHSKEKTPQILKFTHTGWWWLKQYCLLQDIKFTHLFSGASVLFPCGQYEDITGTDSHCISSCFLLDPPQCDCSGHHYQWNCSYPAHSRPLSCVRI